MQKMNCFDAFNGGIMLSDQNSDAFVPFFREHMENSPPTLRSGSSIQGTYMKTCPYYRDETLDGMNKKFRLREEIADGLVYIADSFGSHSYIDTHEERTCSQCCFCRLHGQAPDAFTFIADKSSSRLAVTIYSNALYSEVVQAIGLEDLQSGNIGHNDAPNSLDGFALLKSFQILQARLEILRNELITDPRAVSIVSEMELLVHGFLTDGEVFQSFGYDDLYENGFLSFENWKNFQQDQLLKDISTLDREFHSIDDVEDRTDFTESQVPIDSFNIQSEEFEQYYEDYCKYYALEVLFKSPKLPEPSQSEDLPRTPDHTNSIALIRAARAGHEKFVCSYLGQGRAVNDSALDAIWYLEWQVDMTGAGLKKTIHIILQRREGRYIIDWSELSEVMGACYAELFGLSIAMEALSYLDQDRGAVASDIALIEAAKAGNEEVVRVLLDNGITPDGVDEWFKSTEGWARRRRTPIVEAAKAGQGAVVRLLLQRGALVSDLESFMPPPPPATTKKDPTYRRLHKKFIHQHQLMIEAAQDSSVNFWELGVRFRDYREAWAAGIRTMRRLCNGKPPRGLDNAAAFLCISKAMSETLDTRRDNNYTAQFLKDLDRWQVLFTSKELEAYRELIHSMWGIALPQNKSRAWKASDFSTLTHFQALLSTLIRQTSGSADFIKSHNQSLETIRRKFRARNDQAMLQKQQLEVPDFDSSGGSSSQWPEAIDPKPPDMPFTPNDVILKKQIENDVSIASLNVTAILLMAGAIFIIVIIFLQRLRSISAGLTCGPTVAGSSHSLAINDLQGRCQILTAYLNLKGYFGLPSAASVALCEDMLDRRSSPDICRNDNSNESNVGIDTFQTAGQMNCSDNASNSRRSRSDEPEFALQRELSVLDSAAHPSTPAFQSSHDTDMSSSDISLTPATPQTSTSATKPLQKPRRQCPTCRKKILATNLKRHMKDHTGENKAQCRFCGKLLGRKEYVQRHEKERCRLRELAGLNQTRVGEAIE